MSKIDLELKIEGLKKAIAEHKDFAGNFESELTKSEQELKDIDKPELTPSQLDDIHEAIESGISEYDFTDTNNFEIEYGIDYDGRVNCESHEFRNHEDLQEIICNKLYVLFAEAECPEEDVTKAS